MPNIHTLKELQTYLAGDFTRFVRYSLKYMGFTPAQIQIEIAAFVQTGETRIGVFAARGFSKSTVGCLYVCWRFLRNKHLTVKIMTASEDLAVKISEQILEFLTILPPVKHLAPRHKTNKTKFRLTGARFDKEPSVSIMTISTKRTGSRVDLVICDDIEDETCDTHDKRAGVLKAAQQVSSMLHEPKSRPFYKGLKEIPKPERTQVLCFGTFATKDSVHIVPLDNSPHFLRGAKIGKWPALTAEGKSTCEEIKSTEYLIDQRDHYFDAVYWALQFMLDPSSVQWDACPYKIDKIRAHAIKEINLFNMWAVIDPAAGFDFTVCVIGGEYQGKLYVREILAFNNMTSEESLKKVAEHIKKTPPISTVHIEGNNTAYAQIFRRIATDIQLYPSVEEFYVTGDKHKRTLSLLEPALNSGDLILNDALLAEGGQLMKEISATTYAEGPPANVHDDITDCLASFVRIHKGDIGNSPAQIFTTFVA